jgi:hypothetical protein
VSEITAYLQRCAVWRGQQHAKGKKTIVMKKTKLGQNLAITIDEGGKTRHRLPDANVI